MTDDIPSLAEAMAEIRVVFDANTIDILRKYGLAGLMAGGGAAAAGSQQQSQ